MGTNANANTIPARSYVDDIRSRVMSSMVLWYDIKRQGCTNENMAANPVLKDLSGNGHDATCYNFAWSGMSGIGGIYWEIQPKSNDTDNGQYQCDIIVNNNTVTYTFNVTHYGNGQYYWMPYYVRSLGIPKTKAKVKCNNDTVIHYRYWDGTKRIDDVISTYNEVITLPEGIVLENDSNRDGFFVNDVTEGTVITIEFIPEYPNALVSDGVNDYVLTTNTPTLTDYTIIVNREYISYVLNSCIASKRNITLSVPTDNTGAFQLERLTDKGNCEYSFGGSNFIERSSENIVYQTKNSYNGTSINSGTAADYTDLCLFKFGSTASIAANVALYSIILFDRTLTTDEINWVKTNLMN